MSDSKTRDAEAIAILRANDRGTYTVPTKGLYPFQWNWDSALVALGWAKIDRDRAFVELQTLLSAQWPNGMIPHIVFWQNDEGYFPGPGEWGTHTTPPTSGITQPPVAASVLRRLVDAHPDDRPVGADEMIEKIDRWHQWFATARDPGETGLVAIIHPWESGRDNLPDWDAPLSFVDTSKVGTYHRRDTDHVNADERPQKADYDRYMALVQFGRAVGWDDGEIAEKSPFWVADVGMNAILRRAERDLIALAEGFGETAIADRAKRRLARLDKGFETLWSNAAGGYVSKDLRHNTFGDEISAGAWLAFFGGPVPENRAAKLMATFAEWRAKVRFVLPSFGPDSPLFDPIRYWRGPVWAIVNFMIATGLADNGFASEAETVRTDTGALIEKTGFYEYFSPIDGRGGGGDAFSWTAAMWLCWARPDTQIQEDV